MLYKLCTSGTNFSKTCTNTSTLHEIGVQIVYEKQVAVRGCCKIRNNCYSIFGSLDNCIFFICLQPLVRFRRAVKTIQVLLKATLTNSQGQRHDLLSWAHQDTSSSKREYEMFGLTFDPGDFRAKKEVRLM